MTLRNDLNVDRRHRSNVAKSDQIIIFEYFIGRNIASSDPAEDALRHELLKLTSTMRVDSCLIIIPQASPYIK